jgi:hypothetical protein
VPVGKKTEAGEEILKEVSCFMEQKLSETLPEPPIISPTPMKEKTPIREMVALTASSSQVFSKKMSEESGFDPEKTLITYRKSEIKEISLKVQKPTEDVLLEYVRRMNGEIDMGRCSSELNISNEEIERALENLGNQGKIKIELRSPE